MENLQIKKIVKNNINNYTIINKIIIEFLRNKYDINDNNKLNQRIDKFNDYLYKNFSLIKDLYYNGKVSEIESNFEFIKNTKILYLIYNTFDEKKFDQTNINIQLHKLQPNKDFKEVILLSEDINNIYNQDKIFEGYGNILTYDYNKNEWIENKENELQWNTYESNDIIGIYDFKINKFISVKNRFYNILFMYR